MAQYYSIVYMYHIFFMHLSVNGHLGCFYILTIVNSATMNIGVHVSFQIIVLPEYMPRSGISGSYGNSVFSFLRNLLTVFPQWLHQLILPCSRVPFSPHPLQHLLSVEFLMIPILTSVRWCLILVLICISLIISYDKHLSMFLLAICISSLEKCLFMSSAHFSVGLFFCYWVVWAVCIFWKLSPCWLRHCKYFLLVPRLSFHSIYGFLCCTKAFKFD